MKQSTPMYGMFVRLSDAYNLSIKEKGTIDRAFKNIDCSKLTDDDWKLFKSIIKKLDM